MLWNKESCGQCRYRYSKKKSVKAEIQYCLDFNLKSAEKYKVKQQSKI